MPKTSIINVTSGYGYNTHEPFVEINAPKKRIQMTPENARDLALNLLQAVEASYSDAYLVEFFTSEAVGMPMPGAVGILAEFRKWRETKQDW